MERQTKVIPHDVFGQYGVRVNQDIHLAGCTDGLYIYRERD